MRPSRLLLILCLLGAIAVPAAYAGGAEPPSNVQTGLPNPVHESTRAEAEQAAGRFLPSLPEGAEEILYSYIDAPAADPERAVVAQGVFSWEGTRCVLRVSSATELKDLSGMYYDWSFDRGMRIGVYEGRVMFIEGGPGVALWVDLREDAALSLSMEEGTTLNKLMALCNALAEWEWEEAPPLPDGIQSDSPVFVQLGFAVQSNSAEAAALLAFELKVPEGATEPKYFVSSQAAPIPYAAVYYVLEGKEYACWVSRGSEVHEPSGITVRWLAWEPAVLVGNQAVMSYNPGRDGLITWFDEAAGINRTVAVAEEASPETLLAIAELMN